MGKIKQVVLIAGTHGNEKTGLAVLDILKLHPPRLDGIELSFVVGSPLAVERNLRYIDHDLNRSMEAKLPDTLYEAKRSKELKQLIANPNDTFVIDLHTTTSNMGVSWIFPLSDKTSWAIGADSARNTPNSYLLETEKQDDETGFVNRIANQSVTIEVGPVPQNVYLAESILITKNAVMNALIAVQKWNSGKIQDSESWCYRETGWIDYPRDSAGKIKAVIHPDFQGKDYKEIIYGDPLFLGFDGKVYLSEAQESFWPVFINEAAYYEKGIAFLTTKKFKKI